MSTEINELVTKLNDLVIVLKDSRRSSTGGGGGGETSSDKSINKLVVALGKLSLKIEQVVTGVVKSRKEEQLALKKFSDTVNRTSEVHERYSKRIEREKAERKKAADVAIMTDKERAEFNRKQHAEELKQAQERKLTAMKEKSASQDVWESYKELGGASEVLKDNFFKLGGNSMLAQGGLRFFAAGLEGAVAATQTYIKAVYSGDRGMTTIAKSFTELIKPFNQFIEVVGIAATALAWVSPLGRIGKILATVLGVGLTSAITKSTQTFAELSEVAAKQYDDLFKSFQEISNIGATAQGGIGEIRALTHEMNLSVTELEKFNKLITSNGKNLSMMGITAMDGVRTFAETSGDIITSFIGEEMRLMGLTNDDIRESTLSYMTILTKAGQLQGKQVLDLVIGTHEFVKEMDMAAKLTGASRKQQQEAMAFAQADARFRAAEFRAAQSGDKTRLAELQTGRKAAAMAHSMGDVEGATGLLHIFAGRGILQSEQAVKAEMAYGGSQLLGKPGISDVQILQHLAQYAGYSMEMMGDLNEIMGTSSTIQTDITKMMDIMIKDQSMRAVSGFAAGDPEGTANVIEQLLKRRTVTSDEDTRLIAESSQTMQNASIKLDEAIKGFAENFNISTNTYKDATAIFLRAVTAFNNAVYPNSPVGISKIGAAGTSGAAEGMNQAEVTAAVGADAAGTTSSSRSSQTSRSSVTLGNITRPAPGTPSIYASREEWAAYNKRNSASGAAGSSPRDLISELINFSTGSGGQSSLNKVSEGLLDSLVLAARDLYSNTNKKITILSSYRTKEEQESLYNQRKETLKNGIGILPNGLPVAPPGRSAHERGGAIDIENYNDPDVLKYLNTHGLIQNVRNDPVHFVKAANGALIQPTPGGTLVQAGEAGKAEAVVPMPDGKTIPVTLSNANEQYSKLNYHFTTMSDKFDTIIDLLSSGNRIQDNIARNFV